MPTNKNSIETNNKWGRTSAGIWVEIPYQIHIYESFANKEEISL